MDLISNGELSMTNILINLKIELNKYKQEYDNWIKNCSSSLTDLRFERQSIICLKKNMKII